ncbi:hypothetical protein B0T26DRAFT_487017 [Lasiosphaeria miniovina]|uniref:Uncharacterized protein n=1 Tax=Lasiosphaeria miniovina TaxID=1954250 RepID=A0AA40DKA5_9PEZI|nr:uncharacterized protein B0T26DRAFT_487017 [Lasiosphaeria miniovina]KAK0702963.1 hypothetical protein B0T26DRAFT_487017 [Lasiosphaeria miniovina]
MLSNNLPYPSSTFRSEQWIYSTTRQGQSSVCGSECLWFWMCVVLDVCGSGCVWFWMCVVLDVCGSRYVWFWRWVRFNSFSFSFPPRFRQRGLG